MESNVRVLGESIQQMGLRHFRSLTEIFKNNKKNGTGLNILLIYLSFYLGAGAIIQGFFLL